MKSLVTQNSINMKNASGDQEKMIFFSIERKNILDDIKIDTYFFKILTFYMIDYNFDY
jgi:hypothetical protein